MFGPPPPADGTCPKCGEPPDIGLHLCHSTRKPVSLTEEYVLLARPDKVLSGNRCGKRTHLTQEDYCGNHLPCPDHSWQPLRHIYAEVDVHPNFSDEHRVVVHHFHKWLVAERGTEPQCQAIANFLNKWPELIKTMVALD